MSFKLLSTLICLTFSVFGFCIQAQTLIIQSSDNHSKYQRIEDFIVSSYELIDDFKKRHPQGDVVFFFNGDFSGASKYTAKDFGNIGYELLERLARQYTVLYTFGNHEAFDWIIQGVADDLFFRQLNRLHKAGVQLIAENILAKDRTQRLFVPHFDLQQVDGSILRFRGYALESLFDKVNSNEHQIKEILEIESYQKAFLRIKEKKAKKVKSNKVVKYILGFHDSHSHIMKAIQEAPPVVKNLVTLAFSAHDHEVHKNIIGNTTIIDSGSNFDFSAVELDKQGRLVSHLFLDNEKQLEIVQRVRKSQNLPGYLKRYIAKLRRFKEQPHFLTETNTLGLKIPIIRESKLTLKKQRSLILGNSLADSVKEVADLILKDHELENIAGTIGFYNSSSYRLDGFLDKGMLSASDIRDISPIVNHIFIYQMSGEQVQKFYAAFRAFRDSEGVYSPQLSGGFIETEGYKIKSFTGRSGEVLKPNSQYLVAMDYFSGINGYNIPEHTEILSRAKLINKEFDQYDVLKKYLGKYLKLYTKRDQGCFSSALRVFMAR